MDLLSIIRQCIMHKNYTYGLYILESVLFDHFKCNFLFTQLLEIHKNILMQLHTFVLIILAPKRDRHVLLKKMQFLVIFSTQ